jgi:hypothetical protein
MQVQQTLSAWIQRISNKVWRFKHRKMVGQSQSNLPTNSSKGGKWPKAKVGQSQSNLPTSSSKGGKWPKAKATRDHKLSLGVIGKEGC